MTLRFVRLLIWSLRWRPPEGVTLTISMTPAKNTFAVILQKCCIVIPLVIETSAPTRDGLCAKLDELARDVEAKFQATHAPRPTTSLIPHSVKGTDGA